MPRLLAALLLVAMFVTATPVHAAPLAGRAPQDDIFYQIMPIAWRDSDNDASRFGDFGGMTASLPYLKTLGVTAIWMTPIFPSPAYHGYQHGPANQLNPWFGTEPQFLSFVAAAHAESIKVFVDFVAYHVSQNSVYFTDSYNRPASPYSPWLAYTNAANTTYDGAVYTTWNGSSVGQIKWNLANSAPTALLESWTAHWLDPNGDGDPRDGIDGYRLDHVLLDEGWGYTIGWWQHWKNAMKAVNPDVFTFPEQADWGSHGAELLGPHDAAFTKPFLFAARSAISAGNATGLYNEMAATIASLPANRTYLGTLGDHDVDRLVTSLGNSTNRGRAAAAVLMLQPFPPVIYYGDELGMRGSKANYGSDNNDIPMREPFKWNAVAGPPMSNYFVLNSPAYLGRVSRDNDGRSVQEQSGVAGSMLETYRTLGRLRRTHAALRHGRYDAIPNSSTAVWAFARTAASEESLFVAINLTGVTVNTNLDLSSFTVTGGSTDVRDLATGASLTTLTNANKAAYPVSLPAYGYRVFAARIAPPAPPQPTPYDGVGIPSDFAAGTRRATQTTATALGDNVSELNELFVRPDSAGLSIGITGNLATDGSAIAVFLDTAPGGQDSLATSTLPQPPNGLPQASGLGFDTGFAPDLCLWVNAFSGALYGDLFTLATGGGGSKRYLGAGTVGNGFANLTGGSNGNGTVIALSNANTLGVTATSASAAATATSGLEARLAWADLGLSGAATVKLCAAIIRPDGFVGNQFLPPLGPGAASIGLPPASLKRIAGDQYVTIAATTAVNPPTTTPGVTLLARPNPFRGEAQVELVLPQPASVAVTVLDVTGRRVRTLAEGPRAAGTHAFRWDGRDEAGRASAPGLYLVRASDGRPTRVTRLVRLD